MFYVSDTLTSLNMKVWDQELLLNACLGNFTTFCY